MYEPNCEPSSVVVKNEASRKATIQSRWGEHLWKGRGVCEVFRGKLSPRLGLLPRCGIPDGGVKTKNLAWFDYQRTRSLGDPRYHLATLEEPKVAMSQEVPEPYWESSLSDR